MGWFRRLSRSVEMAKGTMSLIMRMILDIFAQILRTLWAHKLRSFLTMFGVAWGVGSLLLLVGLGEGFRSGNKRGLAEYGENIMFIFPGRAPVVAGSMNNDIRFEVIGTIKRIGRGDENFTNMRGYIPFQVMATCFPLKGENHQNSISLINYQPRVTAEHLLAQEDVRKIIARNHGFDYRDLDAFESMDTVQQAEMMGKIFDAMNMFLGTVGLVTLALGAIGVINIMLGAVSERTREIGLRKALGATNLSILVQFFLEGILLTLFSVLIGMGLAGALLALLGTQQGPWGFDPPKLLPTSSILPIGTLTLAGSAARLYAARNAAMLQPVEALRQE